jgi:hypothetical protein
MAVIQALSNVGRGTDEDIMNLRIDMVYVFVVMMSAAARMWGKRCSNGKARFDLAVKKDEPELKVYLVCL